MAAKVLIREAAAEDAAEELAHAAAMTQQLLEEARVMDRMRHPNLASLLGVCLLPPTILTEFCARGSLFDVLHQAARDPARGAELTWRRCMGMVRGARVCGEACLWRWAQRCWLGVGQCHGIVLAPPAAGRRATRREGSCTSTSPAHPSFTRT